MRDRVAEGGLPRREFLKAAGGAAASGLLWISLPGGAIAGHSPGPMVGAVAAPEPYQARLARAGELMAEVGIDVMLLTKPANMYYLTGDGRLCSFAMLTREGKVALGVPLTDVADVSGLAHFDHLAGFEDEVGMLHAIAHFFEHFEIGDGKSVGLEHTFLSYSMVEMFTHEHARPEGVSYNYRDCTHVMSELRIVKEHGEIERIWAAAKVADAGMAAGVRAVRPGITETAVAARVEAALREAGAEGFYRTYVCSGPRTNIAHGLPTLRKLQLGELVMIDVHPIVNGYCADLCRTVCVEKATVEQQAAYDLFLQAQQAAIAKVKAGVTMPELEAAIHEPLIAAGYQEHVFGPPLHGVGIEFEEAPLPGGHAFFHGETEAPPLPAHVVLSVGNCGLYTGPWGVRVEDTVVVGPEGPVVLTSYPRQLK